MQINKNIGDWNLINSSELDDLAYFLYLEFHNKYFK